MFSTKEIKSKAEELFKKIRFATKQDGSKWSLVDCLAVSAKILEINRIKKQKNAVILAHSYTTPDIVYGAGDFKGDSYYLSVKAKETKADIIIFAGVVFMAETAKILSPQKRVFIPDPESGCSLVDNFFAEDLRLLKKQNPDAITVCYINSTAQVKAESDICVTSSVVFDIVSKLPQKEIIFVPDKYMAENLRLDLKKRKIDKKIISGNSCCCVHEKFEAKNVISLKTKYPNAKVVAHPECKPEVTTLCDFVGGTGAMMDYCKKSNAEEFIILTEWGLVNRLEIENTTKKFHSPLKSVCDTMKLNTLDKIMQVLTDPQPNQVITVEENIRQKALKAIEKMFEYAK